MTFPEQARDYIFRLINLQKHMPERYKRIDRISSHNAIRTLENQLGAYPYDTDEKMRRFWRKHRYEIKILLPSAHHSAFEKLLIEFNHFDEYANLDQEIAIWKPISTALSKF